MGLVVKYVIVQKERKVLPVCMSPGFVSPCLLSDASPHKNVD